MIGGDDLKEPRGQSVRRIIYVGVEIIVLKTTLNLVTVSHFFFKK